MDNRPTHNLANPDVWIRLVYMIVFWLLLVLARVAIGVLAALQFLLVLLTGSDNERVRAIGESISLWTLQSMRFLTFNSDDKPFPFQDWPVPGSEPASTAVPAGSTSDGKIVPGDRAAADSASDRPQV